LVAVTISRSMEQDLLKAGQMARLQMLSAAVLRPTCRAAVMRSPCLTTSATDTIHAGGGLERTVRTALATSRRLMVAALRARPRVP